MVNKNNEKLEVGTRVEGAPTVKRSPEKPSAAKVTREKATELLKSDTAEAVEGEEGAEGDGRVSEIAGEDKAVGSGATGGKKRAYTTDEIEAVRAKLLAVAPAPEIMIQQIRKKLMGEEKMLTKKMKKLEKKAHIHAFELAGVVARLRKVREYFSALAHATYEAIKHLWLKIVHDV